MGLLSQRSQHFQKLVPNIQLGNFRFCEGRVFQHMLSFSNCSLIFESQAIFGRKMLEVKECEQCWKLTEI